MAQISEGTVHVFEKARKLEFKSDPEVDVEAGVRDKDKLVPVGAAPRRRRRQLVDGPRSPIPCMRAWDVIIMVFMKKDHRRMHGMGGAADQLPPPAPRRGTRT